MSLTITLLPHFSDSSPSSVILLSHCVHLKELKHPMPPTDCDIREWYGMLFFFILYNHLNCFFVQRHTRKCVLFMRQRYLSAAYCWYHSWYFHSRWRSSVWLFLLWRRQGEKSLSPFQTCTAGRSGPAVPSPIHPVQRPRFRLSPGPRLARPKSKASLFFDCIALSPIQPLCQITEFTTVDSRRHQATTVLVSPHFHKKTAYYSPPTIYFHL